jgi:uncharacterized membrane protein YraQ (UPF0718 family)
MPSVIAWLVIGFCLVLGVVVVGVVGLWAWECFEERRAFRAANDAELRFKGYLHMLDRWCAYDFPIVEDICSYLMDGLDRGIVPDPDRFRTAMRQKYGERASAADIHEPIRSARRTTP